MALLLGGAAEVDTPASSLATRCGSQPAASSSMPSRKIAKQVFMDAARRGPPVKSRRILAPALLSEPMPLFWKPYKSDVESFLEELKAKKPTLESEQRAGRALLWDRDLDREALQEWREAQVPQQPYVYQTRSD